MNVNIATPVVVFRSGHVLPLHLAMDKRKEPLNDSAPLKSDETVDECFLITLKGNTVVALFTVRGPVSNTVVYL